MLKTINRGLNRTKEVVLTASIGAFAMAANAADADISTAQTAIQSSSGDAKIIGYTVVGVLAGVFVFKLIRRVM